MTVHLAEGRTNLIARPEERRQAHDVLERLDGPLESMTLTGRQQMTTAVPGELTAILRRVLEAMASGNTVVIGSLPDELTTSVAAEQLGISRPTLVRMIRDGEIPAHKVGTHHRLKTADVLALKRKRLDRQRAAFERLRAIDDELGIS